MHESVVVHIPDCADQIVEYTSGFIFFEVFVRHDIIEKFFPGAQLRSDVDEMVVLEVLIHFHDVGVVLTRVKNTNCRRMLNSFMISFSSLLLFFRYICLIARIFSNSIMQVRVCLCLAL